MSKVYILSEKLMGTRRSQEDILGVISENNRELIKAWISSDPEDSPRMRLSQKFELDDPELLNRIVKESNESEKK